MKKQRAAYIVAWKKANPEKWLKIRRKSGKKRRKAIIIWKKENPGKWHATVNNSSKKCRKESREEFITINKGKCACCRESLVEFLTLDHIKHPVKRAGNPYRDAKNKKLKVQLLCMGCNLAKGIYGICPHILVPKVTSYHKLKLAVIKKYGSKCKCCSETNPYFLVIGHKNGDGAKHRKTFNGPIVRWLHKNGFPKKGFRLLCTNCNHSLGVYGYCPHDK